MTRGTERSAGLPAAVTTVGLLATAGALLARTLHYSGAPLPPSVEEGIGSFLELYFSLILVQLTIFLPVSAAAGIAILVLLRFRPGAALERGPRGWETRSWLHGLLWLQIFLVNFLLDLDPRLALGLGSGAALHLFLASAEGRRFERGRGPAFLWLAWLGLALLLAPFQWTWVDRLSLALWCAVQPWLTELLRSASSWRDRLWPAALSVMAGQLLASAVPYFLSDPVLPYLLLVFAILRFGYHRAIGAPRRRLTRLALALAGLVLSLAVAWEAAQHLHLEGRGAGGRRLGTELAYNFCESPGRGRLAVTVPVCSGPGGADCIEGRIDLYDLDSLEPVGAIHPFDETFSGRLEQIVCEDDRLLVGMCCATPEERRDQLTVMSVAWTGEVLEDSLADEHETNRVLLDRRANALWLVGRELVHKDLSSGATTLLAARRPPGIFVVERGSYSERRDSVFVGEFINASSIRELDRTSLHRKRTVDTNNGSVVAVTVDDASGRLYVTGLWGVEILDVDSGERLSARRLGFASRTPLVDERRDLVYVPSTTNGKIYALDRRDGSILGALSLGFGPRNVFLANDGRWFLASSEHGLWVWDAASLAARFKSEAS